jgi:glycolate oxidase
LEDILGDENISEDPAVIDCYAFQPFGASKVGLRFLRQPPAVVLPGSAKEVQAIINTCRRFGVKFRAQGTGYGNHNAPGTDDTVIMDMRRMNRILDLDEKNMTIVVEPYVSLLKCNRKP